MCYSKITVYACTCKEREKATCNQPRSSCKEKLNHEVVNTSRAFCYRHADRMDLDSPFGNPPTAQQQYKPMSRGEGAGYNGGALFSPITDRGYNGMNSPVSPLTPEMLQQFPVPPKAGQTNMRPGLVKENNPISATVPRSGGASFSERAWAKQSSSQSSEGNRKRKDSYRVSKMNYRIGNAVTDLSAIAQPGFEPRASTSSLHLRGRTAGPEDIPPIPEHVLTFNQAMPDSPTRIRRSARQARQAAIEASGRTNVATTKPPRRTRAEIEQVPPKPPQSTAPTTAGQKSSFPEQRQNFPLTDPLTAFKPEYYVSSFTQPTNANNSNAATMRRPTAAPAPINTSGNQASHPATAYQYNTRSRTGAHKTSPTYAGIRKQTTNTSPRSSRSQHRQPTTLGRYKLTPPVPAGPHPATASRPPTPHANNKSSKEANRAGFSLRKALESKKSAQGQGQGKPIYHHQPPPPLPPKPQPQPQPQRHYVQNVQKHTISRPQPAPMPARPNDRNHGHGRNQSRTKRKGGKCVVM